MREQPHPLHRADDYKILANKKTNKSLLYARANAIYFFSDLSTPLIPYPLSLGIRD